MVRPFPGCSRHLQSDLVFTLPTAHFPSGLDIETSLFLQGPSCSNILSATTFKDFVVEICILYLKRDSIFWKFKTQERSLKVIFYVLPSFVISLFFWKTLFLPWYDILSLKCWSWPLVQMTRLLFILFYFPKD